MKQLIARLACLLFGHVSPRDCFGHFTGTCTRCLEDARPAWLAQLEREDRLEAIALREIERERNTA